MGIKILNADIARNVVRKGESALKDIVSGYDILLESGELNEKISKYSF